MADARDRSAGALRSWRVIAPFGDNDGWDALDRTFPVEATPSSIDFAASWKGKLGPIVWRNVSVDSFAAAVPLMNGPPTNDSVVSSFMKWYR